MTTASDQYNDELYGLPREGQKVLDMPTLHFWRWLADHGELEHFPSSAPSGPVVALLREEARCRT